MFLRQGEKKKNYGIKGIPIIAILSICMGVPGCARVHPREIGQGYTTEYALSASEYSLFLAQEIASIENQLMTRVYMGTAVLDGEYSADQEEANTAETLQILEKIRANVEGTLPAQTYEANQKNLLEQIDIAAEEINTYYEDLKAHDRNAIKDDIDKLKECSVAVSGMANSTYN